ncbi:MAG: hypothetical protein IJI36_15335 [Kiritimatiellae bacterium]|nr:hypothetical protein [Kiritimatiellia bacterium]
MDWLGLIKFDKSCGEIEDYCRNDLEAIIAELDKIKDKYVMPKFQKRKNESTKDERERYQEWRREHQMDPLWKAILEIYKKRGLLGKDNTPIKGIWGRAEDVRKALKDIARELKSKNEPEVVCCPKDPTGKLCGDKSTSGGYMQPGSGGTFNKQYEGKIVICPAMMGKDNMIARNGGCGCFLMHELMHRRGMKIPRDKTRGKYERPIENAMIEIQQLILKDLSDRTCKGYDVK